MINIVLIQKLMIQIKKLYLRNEIISAGYSSIKSCQFEVLAAIAKGEYKNEGTW